MNKKVFVVVVTLFLVALGGITTYANTSKFTMTVNMNNYMQDNISLKTIKDGGKAYENKAYATVQTFSCAGTVLMCSKSVNNIGIQSGDMIFYSSSDRNVTKNATYVRVAPANQYYYLNASCMGCVNPSGITVTGRYTP